MPRGGSSARRLREGEAIAIAPPLLVTDVCLKRKIRNFVGTVKGETPPFEIYVKERSVLNAAHDRAWQEVGPKATAAQKKKLPSDVEKARVLTGFMCRNFYDIRAFGAVMGTGANCGQVRGPIQFAFARSIDPIISLEYAITRCAVTNERDLEKERTIGRKFAVPYALYRAHGFVNPFLAEQAGFGDEDMTLFKTALAQMFEYDRSVARGQMVPRACIAFRHDSQLGNARADQLFERVTCGLRPEVPEEDRPPRRYADYELKVTEADLPEGISVEHWV